MVEGTYVIEMVFDGGILDERLMVAQVDNADLICSSFEIAVLEGFVGGCPFCL